MKHLGLVHILLLLGVGLLMGTAAAELTAYQNLIPTAEVGQMVTVTVSLTYNGLNSTQAVVAPSLPPGIVANGGGQSTQLYPGVTQQISYPLTAQQSGNYWIVSEISYAEDGTWRNLRLEAPFTATPSAVPQAQPTPGATTPDNVGPNGTNPMGTDPFAVPPGGVLPDGVSPRETPPDNRQPDNNGTQHGSGFPGDMRQEGFNHVSGLGERPPEGQ
ncbi:MAG: hypothetical protein NTU95_09790 [Methanothrix sp.]|nr:hypothetical protein [Methanothrix sp.]